MRAEANAGRATSRHRLQVRFAETDLMGVVHHATYLVYCEAGRVDWLHKRGVSYDDWVRHGIHLPVVDARLRFRQPARFDEVLAVDTTLDELTRATIRFSYRLVREDTVLCEADTRLACVGENLRLARIPDEVREALERPELPPEDWASTLRRD